MKKLFLLGMLCLAFVSCGEEEPDPWPYVLIETEQENGAGGSFKLPIRFDPATGEYTAVCGETEHGEDCPFWSETYYDPHYIVWRDVLFRAKRHDSGYIVCSYQMSTGEEQTFGECRHAGAFDIFGDYLFVNRLSGGTERICLTDGTVTEHPSKDSTEHEIWPDWVDGKTAYYEIKGARGGTGGLYRQELYEKDTIRPPVKELLFADAVIYDCRYDGDVIFWRGRESIYSADESENLYRYDLRTRTNTVLKTDFEVGFCVGTGDWLYTVSENTLLQIHKETGETIPAYEAEDLKLSGSGKRIEEAGGYIVLPAADDKSKGRLVCQPGTGDAVFYPMIP